MEPIQRVNGARGWRESMTTAFMDQSGEPAIRGFLHEPALGACSPVCIASGACTTGGPSKVNQTWHIASSSIVQQISIYCEKVLVNGQ